MADTKVDGKVDEKPSASDETVGERADGVGADGTEDIAPPSVGFDAEGYFTLKIHGNQGFLAILGFCEEGKVWMRAFMNKQARAQAEAQKESGLITPSQKKAKGRFNLFA